MPRTKAYNVRLATENDIIDISILGKQFAKESGNARLGWDHTKVFNSLANAITREEFLILVLEYDDEIVGMFIGFIAECFFSLKTQSCELSWYVTPDHRGTKAAFEMVDIYEQWARDGGATMANLINLDILNADKVAKFYRRKGYTLAENTFVKEL